MTQPLALVLYERVLPGGRLVNQLQDLNYRVKSISDHALLVETAQEAKPMLVLADLEPWGQAVCSAIARLRQAPDTSHLPVIAFGADNAPEVQNAAREARVTLIASDSALLTHLPQLLEQALQVD
ncbi:MAG TPA: hypothetical protein VJA21_20080 [Verrucomicrobiae bacterium]